MASGTVTLASAGSEMLRNTCSGNGCDPDGNVKFDPNAYKAIQTIGKAGIVQNTWRELSNG